MVKTRSGIKNGDEPLKSILKDPKVSADKTKRNVSIESTTTVWEVMDTDFPTPIKSVWRDDESDGHESCVNTILNAAQQASKDDENEQFDSQFVNDGNSSASPSFASVVSPKLVAANMVKGRYDNSLVGFFVGKSLAFPVVQNYVNNVWSKFGLVKLMKNDDGVYLFKFSFKSGMEQVLERGPWLIRKSPIILNKWSSSMSLKKGEVTFMLVAFTSSMCGRVMGLNWFCAGFIEEVIRVEYEWKPPHCIECKSFGHSPTTCPNHVKEVAPKAPSLADKPSPMEDQEEGFVEVNNRKKKGKAGSNQHCQISGIKLSKLNYEANETNKQTLSEWAEDVESDDEVDEVLYPEGNKFEDQFDIRLKGRARKLWVSNDEPKAPQSPGQAPPSLDYVPGPEYQPSPNYMPGPEKPDLLEITTAQVRVTAAKQNLLLLHLSTYGGCIKSAYAQTRRNAKLHLQITKVVKGVETIITPTTAEEKAQRRLELKARGTLLMGIPNEHQLKFNSIKDAKSLLQAVEKRNKPEIDTLSLEDPYNSMKIYEPEVKGTSSSSTNTQNVAFVSLNSTSSTNGAVNTTHGATTASTQATVVNPTTIDNLSDVVICAFFASQPNSPQLNNKDLQQISPDDLEEMDLRWQMLC
ncbi:ribonuclease H-like domain-containing protein [Tanacetum coccineum]|uniref:Ribonuclease H-like domain-containing protein n=1 Tax=Tanacetum coccineum TaxID=301880 RepID=A0ABQ4ZYJ7_9ASTR